MTADDLAGFGPDPDPEEAEYEKAEREALRSYSDPEADAAWEDEARRIVRSQIARRKADRERVGILDEDWARLREEYPYNQFETMGEYQLALLRVSKEEEPVDAVRTPFATLNRMCLMRGGGIGLARGWHVVVGGASNVGKTNVAIAIIRSALRAGERVLYFALEEDREDLYARICAAELGVPLRKLSRGKSFEADVDRKASRIAVNLPGALYVNREPVPAIEDIEKVVAAFQDRLGIGMFVLDYLQLAKPGEASEREIYDRVTEVSARVRSVARARGLLSIALSQLNRKASNDWTRCPRIYDLLGGSSLENDSDVILLVDHCSKHLDRKDEERRVRTNLIIGKNRHGPVGHLPIVFDWNVSRLYEVDEETSAPTPDPVREAEYEERRERVEQGELVDRHEATLPYRD